ncbi:hypothetical protein F5B20DRAFT_441495 [Whalleya microplaca]|nr:hypothetical protein F5B20DRAFT_441495 [Whalleya microplaca]
MASPGRTALIALLIGLSAFGFYATIIPMLSNGMAPIISSLADGTLAALPGSPAPVRRTYTGVAAVDRYLLLLIGFFSPIVDGNPGWATTAYFAWALAQCGAGWTLLVLEARRAGNRGRAVAWIVAVGALVQNLTWTVTAPLYLALHLATSPVARLRNGDGEAARRSLFVYLWDLALLPLAITLGFGVPGVAMSLPNLLRQSADTHYGWVAFWQAFPAWTVGLLGGLHYVCYYALGSLSPQDARGRPAPPGHGFSVAVAGVYEFVLTACASAQVPILALALLPAALRESLSAAFPSYAALITQVSFRDVFIPYPAWTPPSVDPTAYGPGDLAPIALNFLQYDVYVGHTALSLWSAYLHVTTAKNPSLLKTLRVAGFWFLVGGPGAAAAALLWDRDEVVKEGEKPTVEAKTK